MVFRRFEVNDATPARTAGFDTIAFVGFQGPVYALILLLPGASIAQIALAIPAAAAAMTLAGSPYGVFLDRIRRAFGAEIAPAAPAGSS